MFVHEVNGLRWVARDVEQIPGMERNGRGDTWSGRMLAEARAPVHGATPVNEKLVWNMRRRDYGPDGQIGLVHDELPVSHPQ